MFESIEKFTTTWDAERAKTAKVLAAMTDESLDQSVAEGHRKLGALAWHLVRSGASMLSMTGLEVQGPGDGDPVPPSAGEILAAYETVSAAVASEVQSRWSDADLEKEDILYGSSWKRGFTLGALVCHEIHHRGQMTVLMRQAGLQVPGVYGPSLEEWAQFGMEPQD